MAASMRSYHGRSSVLAIMSVKVVMELTARMTPNSAMSPRLGRSPPTNYFFPKCAVKSPTAWYSAARSSVMLCLFLSFAWLM